LTNHGLTVGQSCPEPGGLPIDYDEDEVERLVEVEDTLIDAYVGTQLAYTASYAKTEELKQERDRLKALLLEKMGNETGTATVNGMRVLGVRVSTANRIDTKRLRAEAPDIARMYETQSVSSRVDLF